MKKTIFALTLASGILFGTNVFSTADHDMPVYTGSLEFERLKKLAGSWEGTHKMGNQEDAVRVEYAVTSNGSAVVEKLFPGTPHEMVSVYHDDKNKKLSMTHYCGVGNRPQMDLASSSEKEMTLSLSANSEIDPKEGHMHSLTIDFIDDDHIVHHWAMYQDGQQIDSAVFTLQRVK